MLKLLFEYGWILIAVILFGLYLWNIYQKSGWGAVLTDLRMKAYALMLAVENKYSDDEGTLKFRIVLDAIYGLFPESLKKFVSKELFAIMLQKWYEQAKDFLDDGMMNDSN